jgi:hypothetical protein
MWSNKRALEVAFAQGVALGRGFAATFDDPKCRGSNFDIHNFGIGRWAEIHFVLGTLHNIAEGAVGKKKRQQFLDCQAEATSPELRAIHPPIEGWVKEMVRGAEQGWFAHFKESGEI